jgi:hypothetical protein
MRDIIKNIIRYLIIKLNKIKLDDCSDKNTSRQGDLDEELNFVFVFGLALKIYYLYFPYEGSK